MQRCQVVWCNAMETEKNLGEADVLEGTDWLLPESELEQGYIVYFLRHGEFERVGDEDTYEGYHRFLSSVEERYPLSEEGRLQVTRGVEGIPQRDRVRVILAGPHLRSQQTAMIAQEVLSVRENVPILTTPLVKEVDYLPLMPTREEFEKLKEEGGMALVSQSGWRLYAESAEAFQMETPYALQQRIHALLKACSVLQTFYGYEGLLISSHASFGRAMERVIRGEPIIGSRGKTLPFGGYYTILNPLEREEHGIYDPSAFKIAKVTGTSF